MKKKIITLIIVGLFLLLSIPTVLGNEEETNNDGWKIVTIIGKCSGWSSGTILHFLSFWAKPQPMSYFGVTEDTKIRINGELYPIDETSKVHFRGFIGKGNLPFKWRFYERQGLEEPYEFIVFGITKTIEITPE